MQRRHKARFAGWIGGALLCLAACAARPEKPDAMDLQAARQAALGVDVSLRTDILDRLDRNEDPLAVYQAYRDHFKWEIGLVLRDWRYTARICNIDVTQLTGVSAANLINLLVRALYRRSPSLFCCSPMLTARTLPKIQLGVWRSTLAHLIWTSK